MRPEIEIGEERVQPVERSERGWVACFRGVGGMDAAVKPTWVKPNKKQCPTALFPVERVHRDVNPGPGGEAG